MLIWLSGLIRLLVVISVSIYNTENLFNGSVCWACMWCVGLCGVPAETLQEALNLKNKNYILLTNKMSRFHQRIVVLGFKADDGVLIHEPVTNISFYFLTLNCCVYTHTHAEGEISQRHRQAVTKFVESSSLMCHTFSLAVQTFSWSVWP